MKIPDWLHHIPSHWEIRKASHILDISVGGTPPTSNPEFFDGDIPWVTIADMNSDEIFGSSHHLSESGLRHANIRWSEPGDLLYSFKLSIGKTAFVKKPVVTNEAIATIHKSSKIYLPFARHVLPLAFEHAAGTNIYGAKILNQQQLKSALIPLPPFEEQKKIANELDRELAEIDQLITDQLRLQDLLQERLAFLTFDLATDASNPDRYETGHPFWKTLPKGWTLQKLGWHFMVGNGSTPSIENPDYWTGEDNGIPWFNSSIVNSEIAVNPARYVTKKAIHEYYLPIVPRNSLLVGLTGQGKTRGMVTQTGIDATINQHIAFLTPRLGSGLQIDFTQLALKAAYPELRFLSNGNGGTKAALTCDQLRNLYLPRPSILHQNSIIQKFRITK